MHNLTISSLNQEQDKNCHRKAQIKAMWSVAAEDGAYYFKKTQKGVTRALRER